MQKFPRRWDKKTCINYLQRKIILNSIAYYHLNTNKLTDKEYDELCRQLVEMQKDFDIDSTQYGYVFYDFDGSTGFDLCDRLTPHDREYLLHIAKLVCYDKPVSLQKTFKKGKLF